MTNQQYGFRERVAWGFAKCAALVIAWIATRIAPASVIKVNLQQMTAQEYAKWIETT